jgi:hypothetical protein
MCPQLSDLAAQSPILRCTDDILSFQLVGFGQKLKMSASRSAMVTNRISAGVIVTGSRKAVNHL